MTLVEDLWIYYFSNQSFLSGRQYFSVALSLRSHPSHFEGVMVVVEFTVSWLRQASEVD
jgi:hypothetical protein